jgi:S1-C subfamily serine protease
LTQAQSKGLEIFDELKSLIISVADSITPAVVHIEVVKKQDTQRYQSLGSGLIIDPTGYILTNEHVVDKYVEVTVTLQSNREYRAQVVGADKLTDLALIKIEVPREVRLRSARLGNSSAMINLAWAYRQLRFASGRGMGYRRGQSLWIRPHGVVWNCLRQRAGAQCAIDHTSSEQFHTD